MTYKKTEGVFKTRKTGMAFGPYAGRDYLRLGKQVWSLGPMPEEM